MAKVIVSLFGKPGSGKSTLGKAIASSMGWRYLSTGDIARQMAQDDPVSDSELAMGQMAPEAGMRSRVAASVAGDDVVVLDGMPRTPEQVPFVIGLADRVIFIEIEITNEEAHLRLQARGRSDDIAQTVNNRLYIYKTRTQRAIVAANKRGNRVWAVNGMRDAHDVAAQVMSIIQEEM